MTQNQDVNRLISAAGAMKTVGVSIDVDGNEAIITGNGSVGGDASAAKQDEQTALLTTISNNAGGGSTLVSDTPTSVSSLAATQTLIAANANRRSLTIFNNSTAILYVGFGASATRVGAKVPVGAGGFYEMPQPIYTGVISGIWASANGNASIYEGV